MDRIVDQAERLAAVTAMWRTADQAARQGGTRLDVRERWDGIDLQAWWSDHHRPTDLETVFARASGVLRESFPVVVYDPVEWPGGRSVLCRLIETA